jgi:signal transduction histidine kinase
VPLERLTKAVGRIKEGFYGERIEHKSQDEIGKLISGFNTMSETILAKEREAKKIDIAKDEFLAMITHELKTPLVPIQGYADMLLSGHLGDLTDKQRERISIIKSSSTTLLQLISDLLDVQKLELGQLKMRMDPAKVYETVEKSIQILRPQLDESNATILNEVNKDFVAIYDEERITQVLTNLIKNSIKAFKPHGGTIKIRADEDQTHIKVQVIDDGVGIPLDKQKKLFTKFYQADASLTREKGGSGLGLSICKGITEAHGGKISIQSIPDIGTTVTFSLLKYQKTAG